MFWGSVTVIIVTSSTSVSKLSLNPGGEVIGGEGTGEPTLSSITGAGDTFIGRILLPLRQLFTGLEVSSVDMDAFKGEKYVAVFSLELFALTLSVSWSQHSLDSGVLTGVDVLMLSVTSIELFL